MVGVGIDVSKASLSVALHSGKVPWEGTFDNTRAGVRKLVEAIRKRTKKAEDVRVVVEPTATYHIAVAKAFVEAGVGRVMVANPRRTKNFATARGQRGKTDRTDSHTLAAYALSMPFQEWRPPAATVEALRAHVRRRRQLVEARTAELARVRELDKADGDLDVRADIRAHIKQLDARIQAITSRAADILKQDPHLWDWQKLMQTIPGVGQITSLTVISELAYLNDDLDGKQLTAMAGLDARPHQSGSMNAPRRLSKAGNKQIRTALFLAAWSASRTSPHIQAWNQRFLDRGKAKKLVTIACARRLLLTIHAMKRTRQPWDGMRFHNIAVAA